VGQDGLEGEPEAFEEVHEETYPFTLHGSPFTGVPAHGARCTVHDYSYLNASTGSRRAARAAG
jgi:hypothetical protein